MSYKNKVVIITGGAGVLCRTLAEHIASQDGFVYLLGRNEQKLKNVIGSWSDKIQQNAQSIIADVTNKENLIEAKNKIIEQHKKIDILINGAGGNQQGAVSPLEKMQESNRAEWDKGFLGMDLSAFTQVLDLNLMGTILPCQIFVENMVENKQGNIINFSSMSALLPLTKVAGYSASKAAIDNFTRWLAVHLSEIGIRVNAISPGFFCTDQNRFLLYESDEKTLTMRGKKVINNTPMLSFGEPRHLIPALDMLCHSHADFITGAIIPVDGGFSAFAGV